MEDFIEQLIINIKKKKELRSLHDNYVWKQVQLYLKKRAVPCSLDTRSAAYKQIIKDMRSSLRRTYGLFREKIHDNSMVYLVEEIFSAQKKERLKILSHLLSIHVSTKERLLYYKKLYSYIFKVTGQPKIVLDLGCGLNPFSLLFFKRIGPLCYNAYDLSNHELDVLSLFFEKLHKENVEFMGKTDVVDLLDFRALEELPRADVAFLFKVTDALERGKGHKDAEEVLKRIPARFVVLSFATVTMSGKRMTAPRRRWVEWLCDRLKYHYHIFVLGNEIFYIIEK